MSPIIAIDPGPEESAIVVWNHERKMVVTCGFNANEPLRDWLSRQTLPVAIEMIACYGMPVGKTTFDTCVWVGRFLEQNATATRLVYRKDVKLSLCGTSRAKDGNVRQALVDRYGKVPGISGHLWSALAVAVHAAENPL